jgi:twitching motility protein PilT
MDETHGLLGRLAVHKGWVTHAQLIDAVAEQGRFGNEAKKIGEVLVQMGLLSEKQVQELLRLQRAYSEQEKPKPAEDDGWRPGQDPMAAARAARASTPTPPPAASKPAAAKPAATKAARPAAKKEPAPPPKSGGIEIDWKPPSAEGAAAPAADSAPPQPTSDDPFAGFGAASPPATTPPVTEAPAAGSPFDTPTDFSPPGFSFDDEPAPAPPIPSPEDDEDDFKEPTGFDLPVDTPSGAPPPAPAAPAPRSKLRDAPLSSPHLDKILTAAARKGASDVHFHPGAPLSLRVHGDLVPEGGVLDGAQIRPILDAALTEGQRALLDDEGQLDLAYAVDGIGRFRGNIYDGHTGRNAVFRFIPGFVPTLQQLGLPNSLSRVTTHHQGMVLVTGPAGSGKSTTLAALVDLINEERNDHILTVEDPVEYLHPSKSCLVNQREVHRHTTSFARALRAALREDPDILVIGELRDLETISLAMTAAETGHLVLATLHTNNSIRTINRLVGAFPPDEQGQIRTMLSESLRAVISQRLVKRADKRGRVAALEVLRVDRAVANTIRENRTFQLRSTLQTGQSKGMLLLDVHLGQLVQQGLITREEALRHAEDPRLVGGG